MKSKNKKPIKKSESVEYQTTDFINKLKRQTHSNSSIFNRTDFVEKQYKFFTKFTISNCGDVENYFRNSLRNNPSCLSRFDLRRYSKFQEPPVYLQPIKSTKDLKLLLPKSVNSEIFVTPSHSTEKLELIMAEEGDIIQDAEDEIPPIGAELPSDSVPKEALKPEEGEGPSDAGKVVSDGGEGEGEGEGEDELASVDKIIEEAAKALDKAAEDLQAESEPGEGEPGKQMEEGGSFFKFDPKIDAAVLKELDEAERQATETAKIISELKKRIAELLRKDKPTTKEARELEEKNKELKNQMVLFEEKTRRIQFLLGQTELFEKMVPPKTPLQVPQKEDALPRVVVCGYGTDIPRFILCDNKKRYKAAKPKVNPQDQAPLCPRVCTPRVMFPQFSPEPNYSPQPTPQTLSRPQSPCPCSTCDTSCRNFIKPPPTITLTPPTDPKIRELEYRLKNYTSTAEELEKQLKDMEGEVKKMHYAVQCIEAKSSMSCACAPSRTVSSCVTKSPSCTCQAPPKPPCICQPPRKSPSVCQLPPKSPCICQPPSKPPCICGKDEISPSKFKDLQEKYCRLQDDFKSKLTEVACLRTENERSKQKAQKAQEAKQQAETKLKELEKELKTFRAKGKGSKEQEVEIEQQLAVAKQRFRDAQDELEELRTLVEEQKSQLSDYKDKYLTAQQEVEEQKRKIACMEQENSRAVEQVNIEMKRIMNQFQERVDELAPMPDLLKQTQIKLQEAQQMHLLAEKNNEALSRELQLYKDKVEAVTYNIENAKSNQKLGAMENKDLNEQVSELRKTLMELENQNSVLELKVIELESSVEENERIAAEKSHEIAQLLGQLETVREESARQVARNKDRCETVRKSMQNQISELERQLAQSRALAKGALQDRDEIRRKMQAQISNLQGNFEDAQMRIKNLQGHVNFLKSSYSTFSLVAGGDSKKNIRDPCKCK